MVQKEIRDVVVVEAIRLPMGNQVVPRWQNMEGIIEIHRHKIC